MRRFALLGAMITAITLAGCQAGALTETTVIGGSDGPTSIYLAPKAGREEAEEGSEEMIRPEGRIGTNRSSCLSARFVSQIGAEEFLTGTWMTASQGYEYYGTAQAEYYVIFSGTDIIYGHMNDEEFVPDHADKASLIEPAPRCGYIVKAESGNGEKYTYRSVENNRDVLDYYGTWDEDDFPNQYSGGASLNREYDREVKSTYESDFGRYYEMDDGTWIYNGRSYKYRLEITGRMNNAAKESTFIYLSNIEDIPFDRAAMASGLSSNTDDYYSPEEAVFIGWKE